jgi:hypothetical protein
MAGPQMIGVNDWWSIRTRIGSYIFPAVDLACPAKNNSRRKFRRLAGQTPCRAGFAFVLLREVSQL